MERKTPKTEDRVMKYIVIAIVLVCCGCSTVNTFGPLKAEATVGMDWENPGLTGTWFIGLEGD